MSDPRVIFMDLEVLPNLPQALKYWPRLSSFYGKTLRASVASICCIGYRVLGESYTRCLNAWDFPEWETDVNNDRRVIEEFLRVIESADAVVTHHGKGFDWKFLQTRILLHGLDLLDDIPHVDTKAIASSKFFFIDNKLDTIARELFGERKLDHEGWDLWVDTHSRKPEAMKKMTDYCKQDVELLEKIYRRFRPKAAQAPNHNIFSPFKEKVCAKCGSSRILSNGYRYAKTVRYKRYKCQDCGSTSRSDAKDQLLR